MSLGIEFTLICVVAAVVGLLTGWAIGKVLDSKN